MDQSRERRSKMIPGATLAAGLLIAGCSGNDRKPIPVIPAGAAQPQQRTEGERQDKQAQARTVMRDFRKAIAPLIPTIDKLSQRVEKRTSQDTLPMSRLVDALRVVSAMVDAIGTGTLRFNPDGTWNFNEAVKLDGKIRLGSCDSLRVELQGKELTNAEQLTLNLIECGSPDKENVAVITVPGASATASLHLENIKELGLAISKGHTCNVNFDRSRNSSVDCQPIELELGSDTVTIFPLYFNNSSEGLSGQAEARVTGPDFKSPAAVATDINLSASDHRAGNDNSAE